MPEPLAHAGLDPASVDAGKLVLFGLGAQTFTVYENLGGMTGP